MWVHPPRYDLEEIQPHSFPARLAGTSLIDCACLPHHVLFHNRGKSAGSRLAASLTTQECGET